MEDRDRFDYVIVGSGAGGGPLACNLALAGFRVLVLEAGDDGGKGNLNYEVPAFHGSAVEDSKMSWRFFVRHYDNEVQQRRDSKFEEEQDGIFYPRSGTLGGCTAHNALITIRPHDSDWQHIADLTGDESWSPQQMRRHYERLRQWLPIEFSNPALLLGNEEIEEILGAAAWVAFKTRAESFLGFAKDFCILTFKALVKLQNPFGWISKVGDPNDEDEAKLRPVGLTQIPINTRNGKRYAVRERLLETQKKCEEHLKIWSGCLVSRVIFQEETQTATGVEYLEGAHLYGADPDHCDLAAQTKRVYATREVILSGGAFNTPQLLMLSGVGPAEELEALGIKVVVDSPGVGRNLQDRYEVGVIGDMARPFPLLQGCTFKSNPPDQHLKDWKDGSGVYTTNGALLALRERSCPKKPDPDLFIFALPAHFKGYFVHFSQELEKKENCITWAILKAHTNNRAGVVSLKSKNPRECPNIRFHYFEEGSVGWEDDLRAVEKGVEIARMITAKTNRINRILAMGKKKLDVLEAPLKDVDSVKRFVRNEAWGHHASCSCPIGADGDRFSVLDSKFRVRGTKNLRVVDASIFPRIPGFFIVCPTYMISEKASETILG